MTSSLAPFSCSFTREVPDLLDALDCSLALTTYQAGKVLLLSPTDDHLIQLPRNFHRPMGMAVSGDRMAVATLDSVVLLENAAALAPTYPSKPNYYDALYIPRASFYTGPVDLHDMAYAGDTLWAVNTVFSCLCHLSLSHSFHPVWKPAFVSALVPEDRCHLNGLALDHEGNPAYVTALGTGDTAKQWRENRLGGGAIIHVPTGEVVLSGLPMPHSPRLYDGKLYFTLAATGEFCIGDPATGTYDVINRVPGFARGLAKQGDYVFIGHSKLRKKHLFGDLTIAQRNPVAGMQVLHLPSGAIAGGIHYHTSCEEIYDVHVLEGMRRPGILGVEDQMHRRAIQLAVHGYWASEPAPSEARPA